MGLLCVNLSRALGWLREKKLPPSMAESGGVTVDVVVVTAGKESQREIAEFDASQPFRGRHEEARAVQGELGLNGFDPKADLLGECARRG